MARIDVDNGIFGSASVPPEMRRLTCLEDAVRLHARLAPNSRAISCGDSAVSYAEFDARTNRIANGLASVGVGEGDRIAVILKNGRYSYETLIGARKAGAVQVAVNWRLAVPEMAWIAEDAGARLIVLDAEFAHLAPAILSTMSFRPRILIAGEDGSPGGHESFDDWVEALPADDSGRSSAPDEIAIQLYTSGTTGRPKGAMLTNANLWAYYRAAGELYPMRPRGAHLIALPLFHVAALIWSLRVFVHGGHCVGTRDFDAPTLLAMIPKYQLRDFIVVPAALQMLVNAADPTADYSSLDHIGYGGSILTEKLARAAIDAFGCPIVGMYGSTELSFGCTVLIIDDAILDSSHLLNSCGRALPGTTLGIFDPETLEQKPEGEVGELWVRSGQRAQGYWKRPDATAEAFREDGWFRTGDMGYLRDGFLYLSDRLKDMIKTGGENVYPAEVERVLAEHPAIEESAVIGVPDEKWGESVKALIVLASGQTADPDEVIAFARARLASFKCPKSVEILDSFPRTGSGKVVKTELREPYWAGQERRVN